MKFVFWSVGAVVVLAIGLVLAWQLLPTAGPATPPDEEIPHEPTAGIPWFVDVTEAAGIRFQHFDSATPTHYIQEIMGSGVAWIDYDGDGLLDLFCLQDGPIDPAKHKGPLPTNKLYRNLGNGKFQDVTVQVGLDRAGYHMGCAVGDYDNDGFDDLVVTYLGGVVLYHNEPDGHGGRKFVDVTAKAKIHNPHFATSCGWGDIDGDGKLDLYICNYVEIDMANYPPCYLPRANKRVPLSCPPTAFPVTTHKLYRNNGDGTFTDVSKESGVAAAPPAPGLAVLLCDLDQDGQLDIYVANDLKPAYLFHNQGGGKFVEKAMFRGCGVDKDGQPLAGMGVDAADVDGSGQFSLFVTNYQDRPNILFLNQGQLRFQDASYPSGLGAASLNRLAFGAVFVDADLDGRPDLAIANGHVQRFASELFGVPFGQRAQLFQGLGGGKFRDVSDQSGPYFHQAYVGRGVARGDFDNDGRPDLAFNHNGGPLVLLRNATPATHHWLTLELEGDGVHSNRNAIGARVEVVAGGVRQVHGVHGGGSYLSASSRRLHIGLGAAAQAERVTVTWPARWRRSRRPPVQTFTNLAGRTWWRLHQGKDNPTHVQ